MNPLQARCPCWATCLSRPCWSSVPSSASSPPWSSQTLADTLRQTSHPPHCLGAASVHSTAATPAGRGMGQRLLAAGRRCSFQLAAVCTSRACPLPAVEPPPSLMPFHDIDGSWDLSRTGCMGVWRGIFASRLWSWLRLAGEAAPHPHAPALKSPAHFILWVGMLKGGGSAVDRVCSLVGKGGSSRAAAWAWREIGSPSVSARQPLRVLCCSTLAVHLQRICSTLQHESCPAGDPLEI